MRYISDKTGKIYNSTEELISAEKEYDKKNKELEKAKEERRIAAKRVEDAYDRIEEARRAYNAELKTFCDKYGAYHQTFKSSSVEPVVHNPAKILMDLLDNLPVLF